eukprot:352554-Chlamydomonas_euryale.AAC.4
MSRDAKVYHARTYAYTDRVSSLRLSDHASSGNGCRHSKGPALAVWNSQGETRTKHSCRSGWQHARPVRQQHARHQSNHFCNSATNSAPPR